MRRLVVLVAFLAVVVCGCGKINAGASPQGLIATMPTTAITTTTPASRTTTIPTSTTFAPVMPGACPPGCSLPSDYDAITVLASSANQVAIVTVKNEENTAEGLLPVVVSEKTLEDNVVHQYPPTPLSDGSSLPVGTTAALQNGGQYLVIASYNRGGGCLSALFSYNPSTRIASLIESDDGYEAPRIPLPGRIVTIPQTITLAEVRARMYPTGGVVYPTDTGESWCPGP
jgi:hypothetical protein